MNDDSQNNATTRLVGPILGFALGALVGGTLGVLLAPASGEKTRRRLGETARRMSTDAREAVEDARTTVTDAATGLGSDVKNAIDAGRDAFRHDGKPHLASRIAAVIDGPSNPTP